MNNRQLSSFILSADKGSFSKAAASSYISTPALLQQIMLLESELGFKLFDRSPSGVTLTEAGKHFYDTAKKILTLYKESRQYGLELEGAAQATIRIGCSPNEIAPFLPELCEMFEKSDPSVSIAFKLSPYAQQLEDLKGGKFDIVFLPESQATKDLGLRFSPLYEDPYCCCIAPTHRLATHSSIRLEDLDGETVYLEDFYRDEPQQHHILESIEQLGLDVSIDPTPFSAHLPVDLVLNGGILPIPCSYTSICVPPLVAVPLDWEKALYGIVSQIETSATIEKFIEFASDYFAQVKEQDPF